jgi:hypothetical protein
MNCIKKSFLQKVLLLLPTILLWNTICVGAAEDIDGENDVDAVSSTESTILDKLFDRFLDHEGSSNSDSIDGSTVEIMIDESEKQGRFLNVANIRFIDKTLGKSYNLDIPINTEKNIKGIGIKVYKCRIPQEKLILPEGMALIEIYETIDKKTDKLFHGWIFAQSPSSSQFSHPEYDITLGGCSASSRDGEK